MKYTFKMHGFIETLARFNLIITFQQAVSVSDPQSGTGNVQRG